MLPDPLILLLALAPTSSAASEPQEGKVAAEPGLRLPAFFSDHVVLERETSVPLWGWAAPGERVEVSASWRQAPPVIVSADGDGRFSAALDTSGAGPGPHVVRLATARGVRVLDDVRLGEVWLASG